MQLTKRPIIDTENKLSTVTASIGLGTKGSKRYFVELAVLCLAGLLIAVTQSV